MSLAIDFIINLAATLAFEVGRAGVNRLSIAVLGPPEEQALRRVYDRAFRSMLEVVTADLDQDSEDWVEETFRRFVHDPDVSNILLNLALEGASAPDLDLLQERFEALGFESQGIPVDFQVVLMAFHVALTQGVNDEASRSDSHLHNIVSIQRVTTILIRLQENQGLLRKLELNQDRLLDLVSGMNETLQRVSEGSLGSQRPAVMASSSGLSDTMAANIQDFVANYSSFFTGRKENIEELTTWLKHPTDRIGMLVAPAGRGKSALIVNWIAELRKSTDYHVIFFPISWRFQTTQRRSLLETLIAQVGRVHGDYSHDLSSREESSLIAKLKLLLNKAPGDDQKVVVVVDGLDELDAVSASEAAIFPASVAPGFHLIVTMRGETEYDRQTWLERLGWTDIEVRGFGLDLLQQDEILDFLQRNDRHRAPDVEAKLCAQILAVSNGGDPLVVSLYVQDWYRFIDQHAPHRSPTEVDLHSFGIAQRQLGLNGYLRGVQDQFKALGDELGSFFEVLSLARGPLTIDDLNGLGIDVSTLPVADITDHSRGLVIGNGLRRGFIFSHPRIAYVYKESRDLLPADRLVAWRKRFLDYGQRTISQLATETLSPTAVSPYVLRHHLSHLLEDPSNVSLTELSTLFVQGWVQAHGQVLGGYQDFFGDLQRIWDFAHDYVRHTTDKRLIAESIALRWKCALCFASASSLASRLPPHLPALLFRDRLWSLDQALYYAYRVPDDLQRVRTLLAFLKTRDAHEQLSDGAVYAFCEKIIEALPSIEDSELRYRLLLDVIPFVRWQNSQNLLYQAILAIENALWRVRALSELARVSLSSSIQLQAQALQVAATERYSGDELEPYYYALESLARSLCQTQQLSRAWNLAFSLPPVSIGQETGPARADNGHSEVHKGYLLSQMASHFSDTCADEFLDICLNETSTGSYDLVLSRVVILLAPHLSSPIIARRALEVLLPPALLAEHRLGRRFSWYSGSGGLSANELVAATIVGYHMQDVQLRQFVNDILDAHLQPVEVPDRRSSYYRDTWPELIAGARTFREILLGQCSADQFSERLRNKEFSIDVADHVLFRYLGPTFSETLIADKLGAGVHEFDNSGKTIELRTSDFLTSYAACLDDHDLQLLFTMVPGCETSGRLRAIASNAHRMPPPDIQQSIGCIYGQNEIDILSGGFDSKLAALRAIAPHLTSYHLAKLLPPLGRWETEYWEHWMFLEDIAPNLNREVISVTVRNAFSELSVEQSLRQLQGVAVLAAQFDPMQRLPVLQQIKQRSDRIGDLEKRYEIVERMATQLSWERRGHIRNRAMGQVRHAISTEALTIAEHNRLLMLLPFAERTRAMLRYRHSITVHDEDDEPQIRNPLQTAGYSLYRSRFVLSSLRILVWLLFVPVALLGGLTDGANNYIVRKLHHFLTHKVWPWFNQIIEDTSSVPFGPVSSVIAMPAHRFVQRSQARRNEWTGDFSGGFAEAYQRAMGIPDASGIPALKDDLLRAAELRGSDDYRSAIIQIFFKRYLTLRRCIVDRHQVHAEALTLLGDIPSETITSALDVLSEEIQSKSRSNFEEEATLVALIPSVAQTAPEYLPVIADIVNKNARWYLSYHSAAIVLATLSEYSGKTNQQHYLDSAIRMALRQYEGKQRTCGIVLEHACDFASVSLLPIVAAHLRDCHTEGRLDDHYHAALVAFARRLSNDMSLLNILWPIVERTKSTLLVNTIIENAGPYLDVDWIVRLFVFSARQTDGLSGAAGIALRKQWKQQSTDNQLEMSDRVLRQLCDLPRPVFLSHISWLWQAFAGLGSDRKRLAYGLTSAILDVGDWWP